MAKPFNLFQICATLEPLPIANCYDFWVRDGELQWL